ncbi:MAG: RDD family protein [Acinetobacter sp.]
MQIYLARNNQQAGPYSLEQVNQMLASQQILLTDLVWHQGMTEWKPLGELTQGKSFYAPTGYQATSAELSPIERFHVEEQQKSDIKVASLSKRFFAKVIDLFFWLPAFSIPSFTMDAASKEKMLELQATLQQSSTFDPQFQQQFSALITPDTWLAMGIYILIMLAIQAVLLAKTGQSLGKRIMRIQIVDLETHNKANLTRVFLIRSVVFIILNLLSAPIITILDHAFGLGKKRLTLHDRLAKTKVIEKIKSIS